MQCGVAHYVLKHRTFIIFFTFLEAAHPVRELGSTVVPLGEVENSVMVGMTRVQEGADVLHMIPIAQLHCFSRI